MIQKIDLKLYDEFRDLSLRYFELYPKNDNKSLVFSAEINIAFGIQDINKIISKINDEYDYNDSSWYYELVSKAYQILNAFEAIQRSFKIFKSGYNQLFGPQNVKDGLNREEERQKIDYFRALRSLTTAHTLETTDKNFWKFGITSGVFLEDVRHRKSYRFSPPKDVEGDIILDLRRKNENTDDGLGDTEYRGVYIEKDIVEPVRIVVSKLNIVNKKVEKLINEEEHRLRNKKIGNIKVINNEFLIDLKKAVMERYPKEIEIVKYNNEQEVEFWEIQEIFDFVNWKHTFEEERDQKIRGLQDIKRKALLQYSEKVQDMELNNENYYSLSSEISRKGINHYSDSKISGYLKWNKNFPEFKEIELLEGNLCIASQMNQVSDEVWSILLLKEMQPKLDKFFKIEWNTSFRELYWQYLVALYVRQQVNS